MLVLLWPAFTTHSSTAELRDGEEGLEMKWVHRWLSEVCYSLWSSTDMPTSHAWQAKENLSTVKQMTTFISKSMLFSCSWADSRWSHFLEEVDCSRFPHFLTSLTLNHEVITGVNELPQYTGGKSLWRVFVRIVFKAWIDIKWLSVFFKLSLYKGENDTT